MNHQAEYLFRAKANNANLFKILIEVLQSNLKIACFNFRAEGIFLRQMDYKRLTLIDVCLHAKNFIEYHSSMNMFVGLTLTHLQKLLKTVKKKDSICFCIKRNKPNELAIEVVPKEGKRKTTSFITVQRIQNIVIEIPQGYCNEISIPASEFLKIHKDVLSIGKDVVLSTNYGKIVFETNAGGIIKRKIEYGDIDDSGALTYREEFESEQFVKICKICNLCSSIVLKTMDAMPLMVSFNVGTLGNMNILLKSKSQVVN
jgi:proliferating cell nuclear antigen PCNA